MKKPLLTPSGKLFMLSAVNVLAALVSGVMNLLYSLTVAGEFAVSNFAVTAASVSAVLIYVFSAVLTVWKGDRDMSAFGIVFWGVTLLGFGFYAAFNIFGITVAVPMLNMTAFLRFMMVLLTIPIIAYNSLIAAIPNSVMSFAAALFIPMSAFITYIFKYIKIKRVAQINNHE